MSDVHENLFKMTNIEFRVIARDFKCARNYLTLLEEAEAADAAKANKTEKEREIEGLIHEAFSLAAVVAYIRPFTKGHRVTGKPGSREWIDKKVLKVVLEGLSSDELRKFHDKVDTLRNKTWAHTAEKTFKPHLIQSIARKNIPVFRNLIDEVERLLQMKDSVQS